MIRILFLLIILAYSTLSTYAQTDSMQIKPLMPRVGLEGRVEATYHIEACENNSKELPVNSSITNKSSKESIKPVENKTAVTQDKTINPQVVADNISKEQDKANKSNSMTTKKAITYSDLDMQKIAEEIKYEMEEEREPLLGDLRILWQAAVEKNETIRFAIYKLSNPDGEQEKKSVVKKILTPLTSVAPIIGMGAADPITGGSALIGGGLLSSLLSDDSFVNSKLSRVTDTELVLLSQEIDNLQRQLVVLYHNYLSAVERLHMVDKIVENRYKYYTVAQNSPQEVLSVADVFYRESIDMQYKARQEVLSARAVLEQLVGNDALISVDKNIKDRLSMN